MPRRVASLELRQEARGVEINQPFLHLRHGQDVAIADDQIDVVERDAFGLEAVVDHFLVETGCVLCSRDPLLGDRKRDGAVAQQAGADIMVIGVQAEDIGVFSGHGYSLSGDRRALRKGDRVDIKLLARPSCRFFSKLCDTIFAIHQVFRKMNARNLQ
jgi:hypothetical protein